jgi:hypothetical protein
LWLDLYWEGRMRPEMATIPLRFTLRGPDERVWELRDQPLLPDWESSRTESALQRVSYSVLLPVGLPPGNYTMVLQPKVGEEVLEAASLLTAAVAPTSEWPASVAELYSEEVVGQVASHAPAIRFDNGLALQSAIISDVEVRPGHTLPLTLFWQAEEAVDSDDLSYQLQVVGPDGAVLRSQEESPGAPWLREWLPGAMVQQSTGLYFYPEADPGIYTLRWSLHQGDQAVGGRRPWLPWSNETISFGRVEVKPWPLERTLPDDVTRVAADYGTLAQLYGYQVQAENSAIDLVLTWQVLEPTEVSYLIFVHLIGEDGGEPVAQEDRFPVSNLRPTTGWRSGEVLRDVYHLALPSDLRPGRYTLYVGLYNPDDGQRLPVRVGGVEQPDGRLPLVTLDLP